MEQLTITLTKMGGYNMSTVEELVGESPATMDKEKLLKHLAELRKPRPAALREASGKAPRTKKGKDELSVFAKAAKEGKTGKDVFEDIFNDLGV